ncbi:MAG: hypothetical protein ACRYFS_25635 [Janthinobacterium lividum]
MNTEDNAESPVTFEKSGGNVFADFGIPDADAHLVKADTGIQDPPRPARARADPDGSSPCSWNQPVFLEPAKPVSRNLPMGESPR